MAYSPGINKKGQHLSLG